MQRKCVLALLLIGLATALPIQSQSAQPVKTASPGDALPTPGPLAHLSPKLTHKDIRKATRTVADWQLNRMPEHAQKDWTWAALYDGFMAVPPEVAGDKYRRAMEQVGNALEWQPGARVTHADDHAVGQMFLEQYFLHRDPHMISAMRAQLDAEFANPVSVDPQMPLLWWWCDALFMAPPVYADMARATGDQKYLDFMDREWQITSNLLYDRSVHLYSRDATFVDKHEKNGQKIFWSRGNGWVMGGVVRVLKELPPDSPLRPKYAALLKEMAAETISIQGSDGLWRPGMLDADSYPLPEISGSAFIAYALAYGVNEGILDRATYWPAVEKAWGGMLSHVYADGRLGCIQPVGAAPGAYTETSSYVYGVGAFLMAGSEIYRGVK
jgi:unsaturated rhamnogalacturonyl hydrolase